MTTVAAVDLGATSGRVVVAHVGRERLTLDVVHRFPNDPVRTSDGLHWNTLDLYRNVGLGLGEAHRRASAAGAGLRSFGIDSWAADYALTRGARALGEPFHYRDDRTSRGVSLVHRAIPREEIFRRTGIQFLAINTIYQLAVDREDGMLAAADGMLLLPDLFAWWLTGARGAERTNASTTALLDLVTGDWDRDLARLLGYPERIFPPLVEPGVEIGSLTPSIARGLHLPPVPLIAVGSHDTASAVAAVPMDPARAAYVSCGTWSLVGVELDYANTSARALEANFTNEAGIDGTVRFLRNVMGLWILSQALEGWRQRGERIDLERLLGAAAAYRGPVTRFDVDDPRFMADGDMLARIDAWCVEHDVEAPGDIVACVRSIVESLAVALADAVQLASDLSGIVVETIHVVGGGARNTLLCEVLADLAGVPVVAGPFEATAVGNALVQARAVDGRTDSLAALRALVRSSTELRTHLPNPRARRIP